MIFCRLCRLTANLFQSVQDDRMRIGIPQRKTLAAFVDNQRFILPCFDFMFA